MKASTLIAAALAAAMLAAGCAGPRDETPAVDLAAEEQAIRDRSAEWMQLVQAKDAATVSGDIFTADAITLFDGEIRRGAAEIQAALEAEQAETPDQQTSWTTSTVLVAASGDLAWETGDLTVDADGPGEQPARSGSFSTVWTKVDGKWRAKADAGTLIEAPAAAEGTTPTT